MRNKIVLWGTNAAEERILVALELKIKDNKVLIYTFPESVATDEFYQQMMDDWRSDKEEVAFPEGYETLSRELSITDGILPEEIKVERGDLIQRAQTEWHFVVLSSKLSEAYRAELQELEEKLAGLKDYDKQLWANLKTFWAKVQQQIRDRTLLREHADEIRDRTNKAFDELKALRNKMDDAFRESSKENMARFGDLLEDIENRIKENKQLSKIFEELKRLQKEIRDIAFTKEHRNKMWERIDNAFKDVKEKRFGERSSGNSPLQRVTSRYNGLLVAIEKMERSIKRDEDDLAFQARKINRTDGQLEAQIRQAKVQMIEQRVSSKREKYEDMLRTKTQLEAKIEKERKREEQETAKREKEAARKAAEKQAKEKIAANIRDKQATSASGTDADKLTNAAQAINEQKAGSKSVKEGEEAKATGFPQPPPPTTENTTAAEQGSAEETPPTEDEGKPNEESLLGAIGTTLGESIEDVVDTVRAVAEVVSQKIDEKVDEIRSDIKEVMNEEE